MAVTHYDLTATFRDAEWTAFDPGSSPVVAWVETNVANTEGIVDEVANQIALGGSRKVADSTGLVTWTDLVGSDSDAADINLESGTLQYRVTAEYRNAITRRRERWVSGWFSLTADINLADVVSETYVPAAWMTTATATLQTYVDQGEAVRDETQAIRDGIVGDLGTTDSQTATLVNGPSLTSAALSATYASKATETTVASGRLSETTLAETFARPATNTIVLLGNSRILRERIVDQGGEAGIFNYANALSGARFKVLAWAGVSGNTLAQMLARWSTDVEPHAPAWVLIGDGVNDATASRTAAQMIADTESMIALAKQQAARVILLTGPPNNGHTTAQRNELNTYNRWIKDIDDPWVTPVDVATPVTDPSNGNYAAAFSGDGLHQNPAGAVRMAKILAPVLQRLIPTRDPFPASPTDATTFTLNPWANGTPGAGWPTNWTTVGTATFTTVARTDGIPGNWMVLDATAASTNGGLRQLQSSLPAGLAVGDTVQLIGEVQVDSLTSITALTMNLGFRNASSAVVSQIGGLANNDAGALLASDFPLGQPMIFVSPPVAIPATTTQLNLLNDFQGQGQVRWGRQALVKVS